MKRIGWANDKEGTVSAFAINRADGKLELLNTVRSGGAGPTYVSVHPSGRFVLVANYFGGSVAVLPILADGRLGDRHRYQERCRQDRPHQGDQRSAGQLCLQRTRSDSRAHDSGRSLRTLRAACGPGPGSDLRLEVRRAEGRADSERTARRLAAARRRAAAFPFSPQWPLVLLHPGGRLDHRLVRLRCRDGSANLTADDLHPAARVCRQQLLLRDPGFRRWPVRLCRQPAARQHRHLFHRPRRHPDLCRRRMDARELSAQLQLRPHRPVPLLLQSAGDNIAVFRVDRKTGGLDFTGHYAPVGNPSIIVFLDLARAN